MPIIQTILITQSVGQRGANLPQEVRTVQMQLNAQMAATARQKLDVDGMIGPKTIGAIYEFQKLVLEFRSPDGRVDPNGKTLAALNDPASESKWARMCIARPLPDPGLPPDKKLSSLWLGFGEAHSGDLVVLGYFNWNARVYRLGSNHNQQVEWANLTSHGLKLGGGLGGSGGLVAVFANGVEEPSQFQSAFEWGNMDFDLAFIGHLSSVLKGLKGIGKVVNTMEKYKKLNYLGQELVKNQAFVKKGVYTIPIPLAGVGVHIWVGRKYAETMLGTTGTGL